MRLFVTGGAGFIGSHYVRSMLNGAYPGFEDAEVTVFDKLTYAGNLANLAPVADSPRYRFVQGDICDPAALEAVLPGHDAVVNFAAETHVDRSITGAAGFALTNFVGAQQVFDAALRHKVGRVVHVSTDEVYGTIPEGSWKEDHVLEPNSPYSAAKAGADLLARAYARTYGLPISVTRCSNNYGPYQFPEKVIPLFVTNLIDGKQVVEQGRPGEFYNIGGGRELTNKELTDLLLQATGRDWEAVDYVTDRLGHDRRYSVDHGKLAAMGYRPRYAFEDGLAETVRWYRDNRAWWESLKARG
jgi:dTDP-glucose 4,6-dehydratase